MQLAEINRRITGLRTRRNNNRTAIQECAVGIVEHANEHGDCTAAHRMLRAIEPRLRPQVRKWFGLVSPISVKMGKTANDDKSSLRKPGANGYNPFNIDAARVNMWWEVETEKSAPKVFNLVSFREDIQKVLKRYENKLDDLSEADAESIREDMAKLHEAIAANGQRENTLANKTDEGGVNLVEAPRMVA